MATSKLRKRLEEADEKTLSKMTENFCMIGTPLPSLDSKKDVNEYKPIWQQEVLDEQGRRRFHGAFTGGFSAGYYNSVGSKEGWTPSTFRSSRKDKEKRGGEGGRSTVGSKPEDFMDEEDLEALREGQGKLGSTQTYGMEQSQPEEDPLMAMLGIGRGSAAPPVKSVESSSSIQVATSSLGTRLLQRMGWRPGQGLGPRVSFRRRVQLLAMLGKPTSREEVEDKEAEKHLWPPPDTPMPIFSTKNDAKGLGWNGQSQSTGLDEAIRRARAEKEQKPTEGKRSGGFGLGALEDESDGEDEVYATGNRMEDSTLGRASATSWRGDRERMILGREQPFKAESEKPHRGDLKREIKTDENVWHDGKAVIAGFHIASRSTEKELWFEAPPIPAGWKPEPQQVWSQGTTEKSKSIATHNLNSADRASILGEARLPGPPPSIQDYLSQKDKERLQRGKEAAQQHAKEQSRPVGASKTASQSIPNLDSTIAKAALLGYMPFSSEPDKQTRYQEYLTSQVDPTKPTSSLRPAKHQSHQQFIAELRDFAKSAAIFKPMSTVMASRFQSSVSGSNDIPQINPGLHIPERKPVLGVEEERIKAEIQRKEDEEKKRKEEMDTLTFLQRNARLGFFGKKTTREVKIWKPSRLLCKRFNVPMPYAEEEDVKVKEEGDTAIDDMEAAFGASKVRKMDMPKVNARWEESKRQLQQLASQRSVEDGQGRVQTMEGNEEKDKDSKSQVRGGFVDVNNIGLGEVQEKEEEATFVKPSMDIFKAVFADDDDDDDEDDDNEDGEEGEKEKANNFSGETNAAKDYLSTDAPPSESSNAVEGSTVTEDFRPTFIPRKRRADDGNNAKIDKKKKKEKNKSKGLLTFSVDDEGVDEVEAVKTTPTAAKPIRPRASDLFN